MTNFMASDGLRAAENGYHVMPVWAGQKEPAKWDGSEWRLAYDWERWCERAATSIELDIWAGWPAGSVGFPCGPVVGIDLDIEDYAVAMKARAAAERVLGVTPLVRYGRKPRMMMVYRADVPFASFQQGAVQILATGRQFVGFGIHPITGAPYEWEDGESPATVAMASLPVVTRERVELFMSELMPTLPLPMRATRVRDYGRASSSNDEPATREAIESAIKFIPWEGADYAYFVQIGMAIHHALEGDGLDLWDWWCSRSPQYDPAGLAKKWKSFGGRSGEQVTAGTIFGEARLHGWMVPEGMHLTKRDAEAALLPHPAQGLLDRLLAGELTAGTALDRRPVAPADAPPVSILTTDGLTPAPAVITAPVAERVPAWFKTLDGGLAAWVGACTETARKPQPWVTLAAALAMFGTVMGRRYCGPSGVRPNVYTIGLAGSSSGKGHPLKWVQESLLQAGLDKRMAGSDIASGAAMVSTLEVCANVIYPLDEVAGLIAAACGQGARTEQRFKEVSKHLLSLYSAGDSSYLGTDYANKKERPRTIIAQPCLSLFGVTTPESFWASFQSGAALDGTLGRMLVFETDQNYPDPREEGGSSTVPADLIALLQRIDAGKPGHNTFPMTDAPSAAPRPYAVPYANAEAKGHARALDLAAAARCRELHGRPITALHGRTAEQVQKLALIKSVARDPEHPQITLADLKWGELVFGTIVENMGREIEQSISDNDHEAALKRVAKAIRDFTATDEAASLAKIARRCQSVPPRQRSDILTQLIDMGDVEALTVPAPSGMGRPTQFYRWVGE